MNFLVTPTPQCFSISAGVQLGDALQIMRWEEGAL